MGGMQNDRSRGSINVALSAPPPPQSISDPQTKRWHSIVIDFSPSEQLTGDPERVVSMGFQMSSSDLKAIDQVGQDALSPTVPFTLRKWRRKSDKYKLGLVAHLQQLVESDTIVCGFFHAEEHAILQAGKAYHDTMVGPNFKRNIGELDKNAKGREILTIGSNRHKDGTLIPETRLLLDELYIFLWIVEAITKLLDGLSEGAGEEIGLHLFLDRVPLDTAGFPVKTDTLAELILHFCGNRVEVCTHEHQVENQRDLLADNIAGLAAETFQSPNSRVSNAVKESNPSIFGIERWLVSARTLKAKGIAPSG